MPDARTWQVVAGSAAVGLAVSFATVAVAGPWESGQRTAERTAAASGGHQPDSRHTDAPRRQPPAEAAPPSAGKVLAAPATDPGSLPTQPGLAARLAPLLRDPALGPLRTGAVIDAATGKLLYGSGAATPSVPASTIKIATAAAALSVLGPDHRIATTVLATGPHGTVLVGGGDPTLTTDALRTLADDTARALKARSTTTTALGYDISLYSGPAMHPIGRNENIAPVTSLMLNEGRLDKSDHGPADRSTDPAADTAASFATLLSARGITVTGTPAEAAAAVSGTKLATAESLPLSDLVERALTNSDNDIAEALARQTAIAAHLPASFAGAQQAVTAALGRLGLPLAGAELTDGSGLNRADALSAEQLARLLALAAGPGHPQLRTILTGLPVAGFSGTLADRFRGGPASGAGLIRAKTGTLTGVNAITGTVVAANGRLLTFAFLTQGTTSATAAQSALDRLASALAACGCQVP
ncbi:D-alanyl-D-alanine carboxypeptidase/D-alanyl-D-alanine-endopeptidase [Streptomyces sp. H10-C2]|uniref:D-alanyl-D-alanine carboxypeptidase/D-alanyl-D-alanine endopeptidase n=1 Tax=unclassified Streptomyces TaxID=2593676 RepID=UPI0024B9F029|nr:MULTISPECIES: D-alanyl-D-alanine carboxypeptidase/D-alanyl-D-alanine-endopeptidase [unclassified Streptomyces]MDJ0343986.1 D-alanyl-D-alanine carboxypeptidase/D-alanyl-D-alanine-endopeptidase [Streptomyces sp. PH10-H1]MDJ0373523.1 D-alanyl-D-alanine carboxypeptidase/D-alanyl-D-alanine-endopeptidase [Streptomyces sp. H10-C2]